MVLIEMFDFSCGNLCFAYRKECNRCGEKRPADATAPPGVGGEDNSGFSGGPGFGGPKKGKHKEVWIY